MARTEAAAAPAPLRMAVLYDCVYPFVPGGGQKRLYEICRRLVQQGWQVDWYGLKSWDEPGEVQRDGIRFIPVGPAVALYGESGKRSIRQTLHYGRAIARYPELRHYDIVHMGQWPYFHFFPVTLFSWFGKARVTADWWEVWGASWLTYYGRKGLLGIVLERVCSRLPSRLVAISEIGAAQLTGIGVPARRITVIHNGIDWHRIQAAPTAPQGADLVYVGRLQAHKNVDLLVRALGLLRDRGHRPSLVVVGDGPERAALEALVSQLGLQAQVRFLGAIESDDDVYAQFKAAKVFVHPSTKEGGGSITSLEANAAGRPVVAFRHPGGISPELIVEGVNGSWVDRVEPQALADGIARALTTAAEGASPERCATFAQRFDWDLLARQYDQLFRARIV